MTTSTARLRYGAGDPRDYTPNAAAKSGDVVILDDKRVGVVIADLAADELGAVYTEGVFDIDCASGDTAAIGTDGYLDVSAANVLIPAASKATNDVRAGILLAAKLSGELVATVDLNAVAGTVAS